MILQTFNLTRIYPNSGGVTNVNLEIRRGDFLLLRGANGAGKSTLIRLLSLLEQPDKGCIMMDGMNSENLRLKDYPRWRRRLGVIPQDLLLMWKRSVYQNVMLGQRGLGMTRRRAKQISLRILAQVGLSHKLREPAERLSGGEARRICIARALCGEPFLLLADEPLGDLDPETAQGIMKLFEKINSMGTAILMVTHRGDILPSVAYKSLRMERGRLVG